VAEKFLGNRPETAARFRQHYRMAVAFEQVYSYPVFERSDAAAKGRLRYVTKLGCAREISKIHQC
jgi:hypothetical protein